MSYILATQSVAVLVKSDISWGMARHDCWRKEIFTVGLERRLIEPKPDRLGSDLQNPHKSISAMSSGSQQKPVGRPACLTPQQDWKDKANASLL